MRTFAKYGKKVLTDVDKGRQEGVHRMSYFSHDAKSTITRTGNLTNA